MTLYRTVSPAEATGKVKQVYDDIMATKEIDSIPPSFGGAIEHYLGF